MARGDRSVRGKDHLAGDPGHCLIKADSLVLHATANGLQNRKPAVAFVQVKNAGGNPYGAERAKTSNPKQQFLAHTDP